MGIFQRIKAFFSSSVAIDLNEERYYAQSDVDTLLKGEIGHVHGVTFKEAAKDVVKKAEAAKEPKRKTQADNDALKRAQLRRQARGQKRLGHTPFNERIQPDSQD